jgi:transcriptional regulator with XRE-family HTH domain
MSTAAVGSYFRTLRKSRKLSIQQVAKHIGTSVSQVSRIETGEQETRGTLLFAFAGLVQASIQDIAELLLDPHATSEMGEVRAQEWLASSGEEKVHTFFSSLTDRELEATFAAIFEVQHDPLKMAKLQGFLSALRDPDMTVDENRP